LPFFADDVIILGLKIGLDINDELYFKIKNAALYYLLYNYSLNQIALSPKISQVLSPKIRQKLYFYQKKYQIDGDFAYLTDQINDKLSSLNLLDDAAFTNHLLRKNQRHSRQYLSQLFSYYHLKLPETYSNHDVESIKNILLKKNLQSLNLSEPAVKNKLFASLMRKGFAYADIKNVIDELFKNR
jgi:SOS response regulatory protein OraA/RecX